MTYIYHIWDISSCL